MAAQFLPSIRKWPSRRASDTEAPSDVKVLKGPPEDKEAFGLFRLDIQEATKVGVGVESIPELVTRDTYMNATLLERDIDIIAIHGLGGTAHKTWTHDNGKMWLRDFAPTQFPRARIYTFGYDSGIAFSRGTCTVDDSAKVLLRAIKLERQIPEVCAIALNCQQVRFLYMDAEFTSFS